MPPEAPRERPVAETNLRAFPFDLAGAEQPFFVDALGISSRADSEMRKLAIEFANLVVSPEVMLAALARTGTSPNPQY